MPIKKSCLYAGAILSTAGLSLNLWLFQKHWLGCTLFVLYGASLILALGSFLNKKITHSLPYFWSGLILLFGLSVAGTFFYYTAGLQKWTAQIILALPLLLFVKMPRAHFTATDFHLPGLNLKHRLWPLLSILGDSSLFYILYTHRTTEVMNSPWLALGPSFFVLFFLITILVIITSLREPVRLTNYLVLSVHLLLIYSVAAIIYPLGFGFDGFIHRATEEWILRYGSISPLQPVYIGQYSLVVWLAQVTSLPIKTIDVWLVPVLTAITLPALSLAVGVRLFNFRPSVALQGVWLVPAAFWLSLHLTTPYNLVLLLTILISAALLLYLNDSLPWWAPLTLALASLATHILLGANLVFLTIAAITYKKIKTGHKTSIGVEAASGLRRDKLPYSATLPLVYTILAALIVPILFTLYLFVGGHWQPDFVSPLANFNLTLDLFRRPYWYLAWAPFRFELLYSWQALVPILLIGFGLAGFFLQTKTARTDAAINFGQSRRQTRALWLFPLTALSLAISGWTVRSWFVFPGVGRLEQGDYPLRLFETSVIFLLPWAGYGIHQMLVNFRFRRTAASNIISPNSSAMNPNRPTDFFPIARHLHLATVSAITLTLSLYLSYPQQNAKVHFPGFNVTNSDFAAVEWIHDDNIKDGRTHYDYVVLANPLLGAAALEKYSFAKYFDTPSGKISYYSIPSGGPLYELYEEMWSAGQKRETMKKAMDLAGVQKAYFVMPRYWKNFDRIVATAGRTADRAVPIDGGRVWVFEYAR